MNDEVRRCVVCDADSAARTIREVVFLSRGKDVAVPLCELCAYQHDHRKSVREKVNRFIAQKGERP